MPSRNLNWRYIFITLVFMLLVVYSRKSLLQGHYAYRDIIHKGLGIDDYKTHLPHAIPTVLSGTLISSSTTTTTSSSTTETSSTIPTETSAPEKSEKEEEWTYDDKPRTETLEETSTEVATETLEETSTEQWEDSSTETSTPYSSDDYEESESKSSRPHRPADHKGSKSKGSKSKRPRPHRPADDEESSSRTSSPYRLADDEESDSKTSAPYSPAEYEELNTTSTFPESFDIVVNWYKGDTAQLVEELDEIKGLPILATYSEIRVFVYVKDEDADLDELKQTFSTPHVFPQENKGRESSAFLAHMADNYDNLGAHTFFRQADMHHYKEAITRITEYLVPPSDDVSSAAQTGMLSLGWFERCQCTHCHDPWDGSRIYSRIPEMYSMIHQQLCPDDIVLTYIGQFVVSRRRLRDNPRAMYAHLNGVLMSEMDHWIHKDPTEGLPDSANAPVFGHTMERCWMVLFRCEGTRIADSCGTSINSLLNGRKEGDDVTKCQCLDEPDI